MTAEEEADFTRRVQNNPQIAVNLLAGCKAARPHFNNPKSLVGHQLDAAINMAKLDHTPRRQGEPSGHPTQHRARRS